jgi:prephenate dehydratase
MIRVAFQGELGAYSEEAVYRLFGAAAAPIPCRDFAAVGRAVAHGETDAAVLPVENTLAGAVVGSLDVLGDESLGLRVAGEAVIPIDHCVLGIPGARLEDVARIRSHPVALAQCTRLFAHPGLEAVASYDTAGAAREVRDLGDRSVAAIASAGAAARYGLSVLARGVADRADNQTRFLAVQPASAGASAGSTGKTLLLAQVANEPGALARLLGTFAERAINISRLDARPGTEPWTHRFFLEVELDAASPLGAEVVDAAAASALHLRCLGSYAPAEVAAS